MILIQQDNSGTGYLKPVDVNNILINLARERKKLFYGNSKQNSDCLKDNVFFFIKLGYLNVHKKC